MSDGALTARLRALASDAETYADGARILPAGDGFEAILEEIDATVLPAALKFDNGETLLTLHVSARMLHGIVDDPTALSPDDTGAISATAERIDAFAKAASGPLRVTYDPAPDGSADLTDRVSVAALARSIGRAMVPPDAPPLVQFRQRLGANATACITLHARQVTETEGRHELLQGLKIAMQTQLAAFLSRRAETCPSHSDPSLTLWSGALPGDTTIGFATVGDDALLFACDDSDLAAVHHAFGRSI